ncbi:cell division protein FtsL [Pasteurellaceae bacterium RH1A]|nr:cell division protein FtsL [Pasteurellaceae bacterium RH1A]
MMSNEKFPLRQVILDDLFAHNKVALILLLAVIITALGTIWVTHQTRLLTAEQGKLTYVIQKLQNQYVHLQLEENSKSEKTRVEAVSKKFGLAPISKEQEVILEE